MFTAGLAHVTLPDDPAEAWVFGGRDGIIIAVDTLGAGHNTSYPSNEQTVALQIPFARAQIPDHVVLNDGPCVGTQIQDDASV